ncbi:MAG: carboxylesterase family protein, partial [Thermomicrobiales bacterium]
MSTLKRIASCAVLALMLGAPGAMAEESPTVTIDTGALQGATENGMNVYKGVPYAAPPVGPLRWKPPQPPASWEGVRDATKFTLPCPQVGITDLNPESTDEDCLHLNVFTPEEPGKNLPVMVWIHGGALIQGAGSDAMYTPINLVKQGVIVITIDYRLGALGYFAPQQLIDEAAAAGELVGNYGTMDQIESLKWVKRNIAAFGGDPNNVTIFGQSGGGRTVTWLMTSPEARGYFQKAIALAARQNPLPDMTQSVHGMRSQVDDAAGFIQSLGVTSMEELRALPT